MDDVVVDPGDLLVAVDIVAKVLERLRGSIVVDEAAGDPLHEERLRIVVDRRLRPFAIDIAETWFFALYVICSITG